MILLLGGTSDAGPIAQRLAAAGYRVLVSQATEVALLSGEGSGIETRAGTLDAAALAELVARRGIRAIVNATHPYAAEIRATAPRVAGEAGIPYLSFLRPTVVAPDAPGVEFAADHAAAAAMAFAHGRPVLLTTGAKNLAPYVDAARRTGSPLLVRVLDRPESLDACRRAGIPPQRIIAGRGPFTVDENRRQIRHFAAGVLVTKDSGAPGGTAEKLEAARAEQCKVVVVGRPAPASTQALSSIDELIAAVQDVLS